VHKPDEITGLNEEVWDSRAEKYDTFFGFTRWTLRKLFSLVSLGDNPRLLDLACGTGSALRYAATLCNGRGEFYGVDNSTQMIRVAKTKAKSYTNLHFSKSRVEELPFESGFFDVVISSYAFHHFSDPEKPLKEANRVLKRNGKLYVLDTAANNAFMRVLDKFSRAIEPAHVKLYSTREFEALFETAGLRYNASKRIFPAIFVHIAEKQI